MPKEEETLIENNLDNNFRFGGNTFEPNFRTEFEDPEDDNEEEVLPPGFHITKELNTKAEDVAYFDRVEQNTRSKINKYHHVEMPELRS